VSLFAADTETFLISPGCQAPPLVALGFAVDDSDTEIVHARDPACKRIIAHSLERDTWTFHNLAFDAAVICAAFPDLTELVFAAYDSDRMVCTIAQQKLLDIASGRFKSISHSRGAYALDGVARRLHVDIELDKEDPWRLKYGTLYGVDIKDWPADALAYLRLDVRAQRLVHREQLARSANKGYPLTDVFRQSRKAWWVHLMSCRGMRVDPERIDQYIADVRESLVEDRETCLDRGLVLWDGKKFVKKKKPAQEHMVRVCQETEEPDLPITETGEKVLREELGLNKNQPIPIGATWALWEKHHDYVKLDEDSCQLFGDELLESYQRYGTSTTQIARAERLRLASSRGLPIQSRFQSLGADTGRTTCSQGDGKPGTAPSALGFQLQNPAKDKKVKRRDGTTIMRKGTRELFIPRPGYYFCSTDYGSMELCGWAFVCLKKVGVSKLAEVLNAGRDPHTELAATLARISVEEAYARNKEDHPKHKEFKGQFRQAAKVANFGFPGGMGWKKMVLAARKQYGVILTPEGSKALRDAWLATWPEAQLYFNYINRELEQNGKGDRKSRVVDVVQMGSGRVRGGCYYTQAANTLFQGLCADIAGEAMAIATREMYADRSSPLYGSRLVNFLHDEGFCEVPIERAHEAAHRIAQIQIDVGKSWAPDLTWSCKPALMKRWFKDAADVYDAAGRLIPWEPEAPAQAHARAA
jgi:DNA polymerase-1